MDRFQWWKWWNPILCVDRKIIKIANTVVEKRSRNMFMHSGIN